MIAAPFTLLALIGIAYLTENLTLIIDAMSKFGHNISVSSRGLVMEYSARWPEFTEIATGMIVIVQSTYLPKLRTKLRIIQVQIK